MKKTIMLLGIFVSAELFASPQRGDSAAKSLAFTDDTPSPNPYVTSGLVAMWDAEWNVGFNAHDQLFRVLRVTMYDADVKVPMLVWSSEYKYRWDRNTYAFGSMFTSGFVGGVNFRKTYKGVYDEICDRLDYEDTILDTHPLFEGKPVTKPYMEALNGFDATKVVFN